MRIMHYTKAIIQMYLVGIMFLESITYYLEGRNHEFAGERRADQDKGRGA